MLKLLEKLLEDMQKQSSLYKPTTFWEEASKIIIQEITSKELKDFRSFDSALSMFAPTYAFPLYLKKRDTFKEVQKLLEITTQDVKSHLKLKNIIKGQTQAFADYRVLEAGNVDKAPYTDKVSESTIGNPPEQFTFNGRNFSRSFLNYLLGLSFLKQHVDTTSIKSVLEIGGGFGTLGEILLGDKRNDIFYINADIPPVVLASSYYLQKVFTKESIATYETTQNLKKITISELQKTHRALNIPSWQVPLLEGQVDLFVNFISFQEMEPEVVKNYCFYIQKLSPKYILLRNIKEGKRKQDKDFTYGVKDPIKGEDYDFYLPQYELLAIDSSIFGLKMEDGFHSELRIYIKKQEI
ncbi:putative sugar O-methyltransferase [Sulfurimonas sp. SAG-AH-194-C21]|nr:putative sugar O-methyltransferase [Sulfurimonas sp. SAG-AH-194-C21]MDF1884393.1 putative sugar O-methyltransferase [Sulfurimonas sp. SAG-AH-194-C21]